MRHHPGLFKLVEGKRVAVVGPAGYLMNYSAGDFIDSFDIVCTINSLSSENPDIQESYGTRTDILVHNFCYKNKRYILSDLRKNPNFWKKVKLLVAPHANRKNFTQEDRNISKLSESLYDEICIHGKNDCIEPKPIYKTSLRDTTILFKSIYRRSLPAHARKKIPTVGITFLDMIVRYPVKHLFLTGFSFYQGGQTIDTLWKPGHCIGRALRQNRRKLNSGRRPGHGKLVHKRQLEYFKEKFIPLNKDKLTLDSYLNELLDLEYEDIYELPPK